MKTLRKFKIGDLVIFSDRYKKEREKRIGFANPTFEVIEMNPNGNRDLMRLKLINRSANDVKEDAMRHFLKRPEGMAFGITEFKLANVCKLRRLREGKE